MPAATRSPVKLSAQEQESIDEFQFEPLTEGELESINTRTEDKATTSPPVPDNEAKFLEGLVKTQQRTIEENTSAIHQMRKMLEEKGLSVPDTGDRLLHHGDGEPPSVTGRARSPSVVYQPAQQRPRPRERPPPRSTSVDRLFRPDPVRRARSPIRGKAKSSVGRRR